MSHLERQDVGEFVEEHLQLPGADDKVRRAELVWHVPSKGSELKPLLYKRATTSERVTYEGVAG